MEIGGLEFNIKGQSNVKSTRVLQNSFYTKENWPKISKPVSLVAFGSGDLRVTQNN